MIFVGKNVLAKVAQNLFGKVWGNSGKILHPRNWPAFTPMMKSHLRPRCPSFEGAEGERTPAMPPFSGASVHIIAHALSLLVVVVL